MARGERPASLNHLGACSNQSCKTFTDFEEAVEYGELTTYLRLNEEWNIDDWEGNVAPVAQPIGVPGVSTPAQMTSQKPSFASTRSPAERPGEMDLGVELSGYGLQGLKVTEDDISDLVKSLGLDDADADELTKGLDFGPAATEAPLQAEAPSHRDLPPVIIETAADKSGTEGEVPDEEEEPVSASEESEDSESGPPPSPDARNRNRKRTDERPLVALTPTTPTIEKLVK